MFSNLLNLSIVNYTHLQYQWNQRISIFVSNLGFQKFFYPSPLGGRRKLLGINACNPGPEATSITRIWSSNRFARSPEVGVCKPPKALRAETNSTTTHNSYGDCNYRTYCEHFGHIYYYYYNTHGEFAVVRSYFHVAPSTCGRRLLFLVGCWKIKKTQWERPCSPGFIATPTRVGTPFSRNSGLCPAYQHR